MSDQTSTAQWKPVRFYGYLTTRPQPPCDFNMSGVMTLPYPYLLYLVYFDLRARWSNFMLFLACLDFVFFMSISMLLWLLQKDG